LADELDISQSNLYLAFFSEVSHPDGRVFIPILDKEVNVSFYIAIKNSNKDKFLTALK